MTVTDVSVSQQFDLDWILHPIASPEFFGAHWEKRPLLIERGNVDYFAGIPGLDSVDDLITSTCGGDPRTSGDVRIIRNDQKGNSSELAPRLHGNGTPDIQDIYRAYQEGYSIVVNGIHLRSAAVANLSRNLEGNLHHRVGVNMYLTPQRGQGFAPHVDTHDVFILQLHGVKHWHVGKPSKGLPLAGAERESFEFLDYSEFTLNPGDALYLPRGFPHEAVTSRSSSLHLTVGIHAYRWADFMTEAIAVAADDSVTFREALPPGFLDEPFEAGRISDVLESFVAAIQNGPLAERAKARLGDKLFRDVKAVGSRHFRSLDSIGGLNLDSLVFRTPSFFCKVRSNSSEARIDFSTNFVSGPPHLESALNFIAEYHQFTVRDIPEVLSAQEKIDLVSRLVSEGLLQIQP
ncbi:cupin domain-containing protein [Streptomyces sp. NPDC058195]|uniref:cupin domain-containing protein n=1 Tax=Streptomyces sp. NPDC058195 TaxID=3346375 RepID=UPI0036E8A28F